MTYYNDGTHSRKQQENELHWKEETMNKTTETSTVVVDSSTTPKQQENELRWNDPDLVLEEETMHTMKETSKVVALEENKATSSAAKPFVFVPLRMSGRTHQVSPGSKRLIEEEVTLADLEKMTQLFYEKAFLDETLDQFIRSHDDPHGARFARWIHQKLSGSTVWDQDRQGRNLEPVTLAGGHRHVVHDRSSAHVAAWYSPKRKAHEVGRHFQLDESRVWMRLHFWAMRESGIMTKSPSFADYYVRFIGHFVNVYENSAPAYTRDSLRWSANRQNIDTYLANGRRMVDVVGISQEQAERQIPRSELDDMVWPYTQ
eukprot:scaffold2765_cov165-Amphora_coffeaeformis.AAC.8